MTTRISETYLPNRDGPPFVPKYEPAELRVVCEAFDANGECGFYEGDNSLACTHR